MGVNLSGRDWTVTENFLYVANVNVFLEKQGCKRMTEHMRSNMQIAPSPFCIFVNDFTHRLFGKSLMQFIHKKIFTALYVSLKNRIVIGKNSQYVSILDLYNGWFYEKKIMMLWYIWNQTIVKLQNSLDNRISLLSRLVHFIISTTLLNISNRNQRHAVLETI